jgi:hypothetical protein
MRRRLVLWTTAYGLVLALAPPLWDRGDPAARFLAGIAVGAVLLAALFPEGPVGTAAVALLAAGWVLTASYGAIAVEVLPLAAGGVWLYADLVGLGSRVPPDVAIERSVLLGSGAGSLAVAAAGAGLGLAALAVGSAPAPLPLAARAAGMAAALGALALPVLLLRRAQR